MTYIALLAAGARRERGGGGGRTSPLPDPATAQAQRQNAAAQPPAGSSRPGRRRCALLPLAAAAQPVAACCLPAAASAGSARLTLWPAAAAEGSSAGHETGTAPGMNDLCIDVGGSRPGSTITDTCTRCWAGSSGVAAQLTAIAAALFSSAVACVSILDFLVKCAACLPHPLVLAAELLHCQCDKAIMLPTSLPFFGS